jgi:hypothetical protein
MDSSIHAQPVHILPVMHHDRQQEKRFTKQ